MFYPDQCGRLKTKFEFGAPGGAPGKDGCDVELKRTDPIEMQKWVPVAKSTTAMTVPGGLLVQVIWGGSPAMTFMPGDYFLFMVPGSAFATIGKAR